MSQVIPNPAARVEFREIPGRLPYRFGSDGSVWSRRVRGRGDYLSDYWHPLKPTAKRDGYLVVRLGTGGPSTLHQVHALICEAFHGPKPEGCEVRHLNGDPGDNRAENLAWGTSAENKADMERHGTRARGERNGRAKLTPESVVEIRRSSRDGARNSDLARRFGVDPKVIRKVLSRETWSHVG
jgi:hypothetical protein